MAMKAKTMAIRGEEDVASIFLPVKLAGGLAEIVGGLVTEISPMAGFLLVTDDPFDRRRGAARNVSMKAIYSGTSGGEKKLIPSTKEVQLVTKPILRSLTFPVISQFVDGLHYGKGLYFLFINHEFRTPGGIVARTSLTSYFKSPRFLDGHPNELYTNTTSPKEAILFPDSHQSMYAQMLCGLSQQAQVLRIGSVFASGLILAIKFLQTNWELLCDDIRSGLPNSVVITDKAVLEAVSQVLLVRGPDPGLAGFIQVECRRESSWQGILRRLWPNAKHLDVIVTGTMAQYIPTLEFYSGGLPLVCTMYASSEAFFGINLNPLCDPSQVAYTLIPNLAYFEFLPLEVEHALPSFAEDDELVDLVDVKLGKQYELVVTTNAGLYRYHVGDILRVVGFKNKAPQFKFVRRNNVLLSIDGDKTNEVELHNAVNVAVKDHLSPLGVTLIDYTSYADTITTVPGHYVLYWEIENRESCDSTSPVVSVSVLEHCCLTVENNLNSIYRQFRVHCKAIRALEIRVVQRGTFNKVMDYNVSHGASIGQYKMPRCVKEDPVIKLLNSLVVSKGFSRLLPEWLPDHLHWPADN